MAHLHCMYILKIAKIYVSEMEVGFVQAIFLWAFGMSSLFINPCIIEIKQQQAKQV